ncbi:MAG: hypothetical protein R3C04_10995 [Hyphomonas sp.]
MDRNLGYHSGPVGSHFAGELDRPFTWLKPENTAQFIGCGRERQWCSTMLVAIAIDPRMQVPDPSNHHVRALPMQLIKQCRQSEPR